MDRPPTSVATRWALFALCSWAGLSVPRAGAESFNIETPYNSVTIDLPDVTPRGSLVRADPPVPPPYRPPTLFSAPLPSGSGARALGAAIRLGCDLSGRNPGLLPHSRLAIEGERLTLTTDPDWRDMLLGEQTAKRAQTLAQALRLKLQVG